MPVCCIKCHFKYAISNVDFKMLRFFFLHKGVILKTAKVAKCTNRFYSVSAENTTIEWRKFHVNSTHQREEKKETERTDRKGEEKAKGNKDIDITKKPLLHLSNEAINKLKEINLKYEGCKILKVCVEAGGCSGYQYSFSLINRNQIQEKEIVAYDKEDCIVLIDKVALDILKDCEIHYTNDLIAKKFVIKNIKNVTSKCSCGNSFDLNIKSP